MDVFTAVAEPTRRAILDLLSQQDRSAGELVASFPGLTQPAVSRHLRILRESGLVSTRTSAQRRIYSLQAQRLAELDAWLVRYRRFWHARLDALEDHLAQTSGAAKPRNPRSTP